MFVEKPNINAARRNGLRPFYHEQPLLRLRLDSTDTIRFFDFLVHVLNLTHITAAGLL
jgi:hypothetical protein